MRESRPYVSLDRCKYANVEDLWIVCCHFNAADFKSMPKHFMEFAGSLKDSRLNFIAVECAFDGKPFCLELGGNVIQVRSNSVLWQKKAPQPGHL
jgi:hypothetical protein